MITFEEIAKAWAEQVVRATTAEAEIKRLTEKLKTLQDEMNETK